MPINVTIRLSDEENEACEQAAEGLGMSKAEVLRTGGLMLAGFDPVFWSKVSALAKRLNLPPFLVIQNMMIRRMANDLAHQEVYGYNFNTLDEFMWTPEGPVTGKALFDQLAANYLRKFERERFDSLDEQVRLYGIDSLSAEDRAWYEPRAAKLKTAMRERKQHEAEAEETRKKHNLPDASAHWEGEEEGKG